MENNFFVYTEKDNKFEIERFHICTWEFEKSNPFIEFGCEITKESLQDKKILKMFLSISWLNKECRIVDLYPQLYNRDNSRFIFNDSVTTTSYLSKDSDALGIIHMFEGRGELCIMPIVLTIQHTNKVCIEINLELYDKLENKPNLYFRFYVKPKGRSLSTRKFGINKSTIIYDTKINERRNIPIEQKAEFLNKELCSINSCFYFNILPNRSDMTFADTSLKNIRTLEYQSFNQYLGKLEKIPKDELMVVFSKKLTPDTFTFFSIYTEERIGVAQFACAILINIICGILLFIPSYRKTFIPKANFINVWWNLPPEINIAIVLALVTLCYFLWPTVTSHCRKLISIFRRNK